MSWPAISLEDLELDLIISEDAQTKFLSCIYDLGFKLITTPSWSKSNGVEHFIGFDESSNVFIHLHIYFQIITGGELVKVYKFPLISEILKESRQRDLLFVINEPADLLLFALRKTLEHRSLLEYLLLKRGQKLITEEIHHLTENPANISMALKLAETWFPMIRPHLIEESILSLSRGCGSIKQFKLAFLIDYHLSAYRTLSRKYEFIIRNYRFSTRLLRRILKIRRGAFRSWPIGKVIAITGADATGKSTLTSSLQSWLSEFYDVKLVHCGKPPGSKLLFVVNLCAKIVRRSRYSKSLRPTTVFMEGTTGKQKSKFQLILMSLRALGTAYDRVIITRKIFKMAQTGKLVICDRYPSQIAGAMDSSMICPETLGSDANHWLFKALSWIERKLYSLIPLPDAAIILTVPYEVAKKRNEERKKEKHESDQWLIFRHQQCLKQAYPGTRVFKINTNKNQEETLLEIKKLVWNLI